MKLGLTILVLTTSFLISSAFALVDYSEPHEFKPSVSASSSKRQNGSKMAPSIGKISSTPAGGKMTPSGMFAMSTGFDSKNVKVGDVDGKVNTYVVNGRFQTSWDVFLDADYWYASSSDSQIASESGEQQGNPTVKLGFNWLKWGRAEDMATVNFYFGSMWKSSSSSAFGSSRIDKIVGVETTKNFMNFVFGLGYELRLTGQPENRKEMDIGNIQKISAAFGWMVSPDIRIMLEGGTYTIAESSDNERELALRRKLSLGYVSPKLLLAVSPFFEVELGAVFRTRRTKMENIQGVKLWDLKGFYGNSLFAGLNISI